MDLETAIGILVIILVIVLFFWSAWGFIQKARQMPRGKVIRAVVFLFLAPALGVGMVIGTFKATDWHMAYQARQEAKTVCVGRVILDTGLNERFIDVDEIDSIKTHVGSIRGTVPGHEWYCFPDIDGQVLTTYSPPLDQ